MMEYFTTEVHTYVYDLCPCEALSSGVIKFYLKHAGRKAKASEINATQRRKYYSFIHSI
jgi:hypothetical protein